MKPKQTGVVRKYQNTMHPIWLFVIWFGIGALSSVIERQKWDKDFRLVPQYAKDRIQIHFFIGPLGFIIHILTSIKRLI